MQANNKILKKGIIIDLDDQKCEKAIGDHSFGKLGNIQGYSPVLVEENSVT